MQEFADTSLAKDVTAVANIVEHILTSLAIIAGAAWGYFKFFKGRTFKQRLVPKLVCKIQRLGSISYLVIDIELTNVGLSKVLIMSDGTGLTIYAGLFQQLVDTSLAEELEWKWMASIDIFKDHDWIEPGEILCERLVFNLPKLDQGIAKSVVKIVSNKQMWSASSVALEELNSKNDEQ